MAVWRFPGLAGVGTGGVRRWRAVAIAASALLCSLASASVSHTFTFLAPPGTTKVDLVGTFNNWNKDAAPMRIAADGRTWTLTVQLEPGKVEYKFVVNGETWVTDPNAKSVNDGNGHMNSVLLVVPEDYATPAAEGDGVIAASALRHEPDEPDLNYDRGELQIAVRCRPGDIQHVMLNVRGESPREMALISADDLYARYRGALRWDRNSPVAYDFKLIDGPRTAFFGPKGLTDQAAGNFYEIDPKTYKPFSVPEWVERSVIYQIFPDRFANGDKSNDPPNVQPWDSKLNYGSWLGGDVAGVDQHLDYLRGLGITCIYFNPVFQSPVYHRYETSDYHLIARELGTNQEFDVLTKRLRAAGIRTVLDGVFNHTATDFAPFADVVKNGAASPYKDWYTFKGFPVKLGRDHNYVAWYDYPSMPKLNHANPEVNQYFLDVPVFWNAQASIAGWRLDVANEIPDDFWRRFRTVVKGLSPDDWIVGEEWGDASHWLKGDMWDSVMNYPFLFATTGFVGTEGDGKPSTYMSKLLANYGAYAPQVSRNLMNLVDSHDTARILTVCGGNRQLADLAAILEFGWVGAPTVYYGDELGMAGGKDPDNRRGMTWDADTPSNPTLNLYRTLIAAREQSPELQSGDPIPLLVDDRRQALAFGRLLGGRFAICAVNRSTASQTLDLDLNKLPRGEKTLYDVLHQTVLHIGSDGTLTINLPALTGTLLTPEPVGTPSVSVGAKSSGHQPPVSHTG